MEGAGGRSKREVIYVHIRLIHFLVQQKPIQHCKATVPQLKKTNTHMIISVDTKIFFFLQDFTSIYDKNSPEGDSLYIIYLLNIIKAIYEKPRANTILKAFPLRSGTR